MTKRQNKNAKPKLNAEAAYENAHLVAQDQLERIRELLFDMTAPAPGDDEHPPIHWGHVGSVNHVNEKLGEIIAFLDDED